MNTLEVIQERLKRVLSNKRYIHSENVMATAVKLASKYKLDESKAALAGMLHDCARDIKGEELYMQCETHGVKLDSITKLQPELLHAPLGSKLASSLYQVKDKDILDSIQFHTTGCKDMSLLSKVIFMADYIEPKRNFPGIEEVRILTYNDIDSALLLALDKTIRFIISRGHLVHPDTIDARNYLIMEREKNEKSF
jgi:predicted HD superfamily hydrolase involved in NAD metabolism